jgi:hypothetical protein
LIDRHTLVTRHNPLYTKFEIEAPLSVGNGAFCFTADFTGLQTFSAEYAAGEGSFPLCTMAEWGWHSYADALKDDSLLRLEPFDTWGRTVGYAVNEAEQEAVFKRLRQNAHKFHLGKIGFERDGTPLSFTNVTPRIQQLNLWEGVLYSEFTVDGVPVKTETFVHPEEDTVYIRSVSPLIKEGILQIVLTFPYGSHKKDAADFTHPLSHNTSFSRNTDGGFIFEREMDGTRYQVTVAVSGIDVTFHEDSHTAVFISCTETLTIALQFEPITVPAMSLLDGNYKVPHQSGIPSFDAAKTACMAFWETYWTQGGALDLSRSSDSRAHELERRIVLSQYLTAIQSRGRLPPAETGLTCNSWYGKFHFEMYYWHTAHFALWGRKKELKKSLAYYKTILPVARKIAASQGYHGARWPKMCDSTAYNTPSSIAVLLIWQQPHPIMLAELCYRAGEGEAFLREYRDVIVETAEFMVSFLHWDGSRYVLGSPYIPAQERHDPKSVLNAAYELEYFRWGLQQADVWLHRLGETTSHFGDVAEKIALPSQKDGVYLAHENCPDTFTTLPFYTDHPSMLAMYGVLNSNSVDPAIMSATLDKVLAVWDMNTFYGWDFPMLAMCAARLGRKEDALRFLLMESPKNTYLPNGHNKQNGNGDLPLYLPGNGGFLLSVAMMSAGWEGDSGEPAPGFPDDGSFVVSMENLTKYV